MPLWLDVCLLGLATGEPLLPTWMELGLVAGIGVLPIAWMQWQRPFYIFSLVFLAVRPDKLSEDRRRILRLFRDPLVKFLTAVAPIPLIWGLGKIYALAPLASDMTPLPEGSRALGLLIAVIAFLLANLFIQVPVSVLRVLLTPQRVFQQVLPYDLGSLKQDFTVLGLRVNRILPDWTEPTVRPAKSSDDVFEATAQAFLEQPGAAATDLTADVGIEIDAATSEDQSSLSPPSMTAAEIPAAVEKDWKLAEDSFAVDAPESNQPEAATDALMVDNDFELPITGGAVLEDAVLGQTTAPLPPTDPASVEADAHELRVFDSESSEAEPSKPVISKPVISKPAILEASSAESKPSLAEHSESVFDLVETSEADFTEAAASEAEVATDSSAPEFQLDPQD